MATVEGWSDLFTKCQDIGDAILQCLDVESSLACRLVCKDWRYVVNNFKPLWSELNTHDVSCHDHDSCSEPKTEDYLPITDDKIWDYWNARQKRALCNNSHHIQEDMKKLIAYSSVAHMAREW